MKSTILAFCISASILVSGRAVMGAPARLAVIGDADSRNLSALITAQLSRQPDVTLVEREDLTKIGDERKLQELASSNATALGQLIHADGLLFVDKESGHTRIRLTAVELGFVLLDQELGTSPTDDAAAQSIAAQCAGYTGKLTLKQTQAILISVLNLRSELYTMSSARMERDLTGLLEKQLAMVPEYVLLERRHAGPLGFERAQDVNALPLLNGEYLVDGSISVPTQNARITVRLRLRRKGQDSTDIQVSGDEDHLGDLADRMTDKIRGVTSHSAAPAAWQSAKEAREFLQEGIWGWRNKSSELAMEALDSAELLGETAPDLTAVRVALLLDRAGDGIVAHGGMPLGDRAVTGRSLDDRLDDLEEAITETVRYSNAHSEASLQILNPAQELDARTFEMKKVCISLGTEMISRLEKAGSRRTDELRKALRAVTGYDPLDGQLATNTPAAPWLSQDTYINQWPLTLDEALAFLEVSCTLPNQRLPSILVGSEGQGFCSRFLKTPEEEKAGFNKFVSILRTKPEARMAYLAIVSALPDAAAASAAFKQYIDELWNRRDLLVADNPPRLEWFNVSGVPDTVRRQNAANMIPLLRYYLQHRNGYPVWHYAFAVMWQPDQWTHDQAAQIWADYLAFKERAEADFRASGKNAEALEMNLATLEEPFSRKFPDIAAASQTQAGPSLAVNEYWNPGKFFMASYVTAGNDLYVDGLLRDGQGGFHLYKLGLPRLDATEINLPELVNVEQVTVAPDGLYIDYYVANEPRPNNHHIGRYDAVGRAWTTYSINTDFSKYYILNGQIYLRVAQLGNGLAKYDPQGGQATVLVSSRRTPPLNQFDGPGRPVIKDVLAGPGGKPCVEADDGIFFIQENPGNWVQAMKTGRWGFSVPDENGLLLFDFAGHMAFADIGRQTLTYLMTPAGSTGPRFKDAIWDSPTDYHLSIGEVNVGWHDGTCYILRPPVGTQKTNYLLVYTKTGGRKPRSITLQFPNGQNPAGLHLVTSDAGLCLVGPWQGGVWFISYGDLNKMLP